MNDFTVAIYCFLDDYLKIAGPKTDSKQKLNDAEILTTALISARYFGGNMAVGRNYMQTHWGCQMPHKSNFNRRLHRLSLVVASFFLALADSLKQMNSNKEYIIDSFPVAVCRNIRIARCKLLRNNAYRGYNVSKREYFYGFKVQLITTADGIPVEYFMVAGSIHDATAFKAMNIDLPSGSKIYADSAYTNYELEDLYSQCEDILILTERKSNSKRKDHPASAFIKNCMRKRIETTFSEIEAAFPRSIHAVTPKGFLLKIKLFLFAFTLGKCI